MTVFSAENITAGYGKSNVIQNISFSVDGGCLMGVIGANGSGKTTLLKALCGILDHSGSCRIDDVVLERQSPKQLSQLCSYIPQRSGISIDISVLDVVLMGFNPHLKLLERPSAAMKNAAMQALEQVGLGGKSNENYLHLSEGQKQLCIFARTLASGSQLLLLDEPESALDFRFRYQMLALLQDYIADGAKAAVVTLHDPMLALNCCDRLMLLSEGGILGKIDTKTDPIDKMEQMLGAIYGDVSLQYCADRSGKERLVMLREEL